MAKLQKNAYWKIALAVGILFTLVAFILGWIGFGVPDWHGFTHYGNGTQEYYGLWAYCQQPAPLYNTICRRWPSAADQLFNGTTPSFIRASDGLITVGMILLSLGFIAAIITAVLPLLAYLAGVLLLLAFIFLVIGLPIFGRQSNSLSDLRGDYDRSKRYGFWLMVPTIIFSFLAALIFFAAGFLYQKFGFGNIATHSFSRQAYGGQRLLGPANILPGAAYGQVPMYRAAFAPPVASVAAIAPPSLLSQYIAQRMPRYYAPVGQKPLVATTLPQPTVMPVGSQPAYVQPAYYRAPMVSRPVYGTPINLTGQTIVGPAVRLS